MPSRKPARAGGAPSLSGIEPAWRLVRLDASHPVAAFTCGTRPGSEAIDRYLREQALHEQAARLAAVWVVEQLDPPAEIDRLVGFFSLSPVSIRIAPAVMTALAISAPYHMIGGWLLGRLGVAHRHQGKGIGRLLTASAISTAAALSRHTAGVILAVDPVNEAVMHWYLGLDFGFQRLAPNDPGIRRLAMRLPP